MRIILPLTLCAFLFAGCASPEVRLEPEVVNRIQEGTTTRQEVQRLLGEPSATLQGSDQQVVADYSFSRLLPNPRATGSIGSIWHRAVSVLYGTNGVVLKKTFFETEQRIHREHKRVWIGQLITEEDLAGINAGSTTFAELTNRFGRPASKGLTLQGNFSYIWYYGKSSPTGASVRGQELQIIFGNDGKVIVFRIHSNVPLPIK